MALGARLSNPEKQGMVLASAKTELQTLLESLPLPPVDPMPWWLMKYKRLNYWYADGGSDNAANFSVNFTTPHDQINAHRAEHVETVGKALAFARETQSPRFPSSLDAELVRQGADLFHGRTPPVDATGFRACKTCHGTYTKKPEQADLSRPGSWTVDYNFSDVLRNVHTDTSYNATLQQLRPIADNINRLAVYFADQGKPELIPHASVPDKEGYVAPPLVGVWASAPYFHNGSVPTIEAVLNSEIRPEIWARDNRDPYAYDLVKVGMQYRPVSRDEFESSAASASRKPFLSKAAIEHGTNYDTTEFGHGNMGHTFGDRLSATERTRRDRIPQKPFRPGHAMSSTRHGDSHGTLPGAGHPAAQAQPRRRGSISAGGRTSSPTSRAFPGQATTASATGTFPRFWTTSARGCARRCEVRSIARRGSFADFSGRSSSAGFCAIGV